MEIGETTKLSQGTWDNLSTDEMERKPKVEFEINKEVILKFPVEFEEPREVPNKTGPGVFYIFDVLQIDPATREAEQKVIMTSAWSLLRGLKALQPLTGSVVKIIKKMEGGKQHFEVTPHKLD